MHVNLLLHSQSQCHNDSDLCQIYFFKAVRVTQQFPSRYSDHLSTPEKILASTTHSTKFGGGLHSGAENSQCLYWNYHMKVTVFTPWTLTDASNGLPVHMQNISARKLV